MLYKPKEVAGYEGLYEINNAGVLFTLPHWRNKKDGRRQWVPAHVHFGKVDNTGYKMVCLYKEGKKPWRVSIHRLVAIHFIDNPLNLKQSTMKRTIKFRAFDPEIGLVGITIAI